MRPHPPATTVRWLVRSDGASAVVVACDFSYRGAMALLTIGTAFFLAELGDKTMLATITLATTEEPIRRWLGSTAGMVAADAIAIAVGAVLGSRLPDRAIKLFASTSFVVFGAILVAEGLGLP